MIAAARKESLAPPYLITGDCKIGRRHTTRPGHSRRAAQARDFVRLGIGSPTRQIGSKCNASDMVVGKWPPCQDGSSNERGDGTERGGLLLRPGELTTVGTSSDAGPQRRR